MTASAGDARPPSPGARAPDRAGRPEPAPPATGEELARLFRAKLAERGESRAAPAEAPPTAPEAEQAAPPTRPVAGRPGGDRASGRYGADAEREGDASPGAPAGAGAPSVAAPAAAPGAQAAVALGLDPAAVAGIERMAAAVAAALSRGEHPVYAVQFNGSALADGALLFRDVGGSLTVRLEGVAAAALALPPAALEAELRTALDRRRVRLGRLEWGTGAPALGITRSQSKRFAEGADDRGTS